MSYCYLVTCEHASCLVPLGYEQLFDKSAQVLPSHRGCDIGAYSLYQLFSKIPCHAQAGEYTRLLIDLNRTLNHSTLFSEFTRTLPISEKQKIINTFYLPYVNQIDQWILQAINAQKKIFHVSIHSFTPVLADETRNTDIGLLSDPKNKEEKDFCKKWQKTIQEHLPEYRTRMNYPYLGTSNSLTMYFRKKYSGHYNGIELEVNQQLFLNKTNLEEFKELFFLTFQQQIIL